MPPVSRIAAPGCIPESLKDPCDDRPVKEVPLPPAQLLNTDIVFKEGQTDTTALMRHLSLEGMLSQELLLEIVKKASNIFEQEPNMLTLNDPITVVGDIHGQYYDLVKLIEVGGEPGDTQYLFLGDYVDRGSFSVEVVAVLCAYKIKHSKRLRMLRGNHECRQMTSFFNFREECEYKYDISVYDAIMDCFDMLPVAATINGKFLAVHGGLSPELTNLRKIAGINRFQEVPREGLLCDLLWADPMDKEGAKPKKNERAFIQNDVRGCSYFFTLEGASKFLQKNSLLSIIRAHEAQLEGYKMHKTNPATGFPAVITVFSAPNYCDCYNNKGAVLKFNNSTLNILQFNCSPHPYHLPNFMDIFAWSVPFVIEKVTDMLSNILQPSDKSAEDVELPDLPEVVKTAMRASLNADENAAVDLATKLGQLGNDAGPGKAGKRVSALEDSGAERDRLRRKIRTVAKMSRMFKVLRQENETVLKLKGVCPGHKLKADLLLDGKEGLTSEKQLFGHAAKIDITNEKRPGERPKNGGDDGVDFAEGDEE